jgi:hypothetical protein
MRIAARAVLGMKRRNVDRGKAKPFRTIMGKGTHPPAKSRVEKDGESDLGKLGRQRILWREE